ncbi:aspartyl-phosphate phosphatase Spo0E family protein [Clostridium sp.]|uniref:aspartyl-phosphate phosphatase Spo0E family protein n=1 Tax=Clostridium sp. TaxID=1506 RepID=UPI001A584989|nr:aspartyl-phosphate phosphatase Spo0E family protein [Clostridium sp.]MBK5236534.1 aspartyl-phosphate phosphatase Spo0E family protein [Clostridium sp.]
MERNVVGTSTDTTNKLVEKVVNLYFSGVSVREALKEVMTTEVLRKKLDRLIVKNNFNLTDPEVVRLSQRLDKHILKEQKNKAALQSNLE